MEKTFDLEEQFNEFLGSAGGSGEEIDSEFREQLRRAFYAGCGRTLLILNEYAVNMEEDQGVSVIDHLFRQVHSFFLYDVSSNDFTDNDIERTKSKEWVYMPVCSMHIKDSLHEGPCVLISLIKDDIPCLSLAKLPT